MSDVFTKAKRSEVMSRIRGRGNKETELARIRFFCRERITGWRRHVEVRIADCGLRNGAKPRTSHQSGKGVFSALRVRPDFVFPKFKVAVFVDGCFWHGCPLHATQAGDEPRVLAEETGSQQDARPAGDAQAARERLARAAHLGARACPQAREAARGADSAIPTLTGCSAILCQGGFCSFDLPTVPPTPTPMARACRTCWSNWATRIPPRQVRSPCSKARIPPSLKSFMNWVLASV